MLQFDIRTLSFITVLVVSLMAAAMLLLWRTTPDDRSARY